MDPFSAIAGSVGLIDVCFRVGSYLKSVEESAGKVEEEIAALSHDIDTLVGVYESLEEIWLAHQNLLSGAEKPDAMYANNLWRDVFANLKDCRKTVEKLEILLEGIVGKNGPKVTSKLDGIRKQLRLQSREAELDQIRHRLTNSQASLQLLLTALNLLNIRSSFESTDLSLNRLTDKVGSFELLSCELRAQLAQLKSLDTENLHNSITSATAVASLVSFNKHFYIPHPVSSIFTGRETLLKELKNDLETSSPLQRNHMQKRFVIYGLGGSGKTEFCCKFAQDNRESFWGVFFIDASSHEAANHTLSEIAKIGGVEPNERAAKSWLSSLEHPWLLIIDNADDPTIVMEDFIPQGQRGVILITTRNPSNKVYGTFGSRFYAFEKLGTHDASDLLLKAADQPSPWNIPTLASASNIVETLGFLPLAIIHAGRAIMDGLCSLGNYLEFYHRSWERIRRSRNVYGFKGELNINMNVYSTYEIIYTGLEHKNTETSRDAIELLKTFSFLYRENIQVEMLVAAARNPRLELEQQAEEGKNPAVILLPETNKSWPQLLRGLASRVLEPILRERGRTVLPAVLHDIEAATPFDQDRLRSALTLLTQLGLAFYQTISDSYSLHPLVHTWVRERPQTSTAEQAIWCQAATTILARCIQFRPLAIVAELDERLRRDILPHVNHVRRCQKDIQTRLSENQNRSEISWLLSWRIPSYTFSRNQAQECSKFSLVYLHCGAYDEAVELQLAVKNFLCKNLGSEHVLSMDIMLLLSHTYMQQARNKKATDLQKQVLKAALNTLGPDHPKTLKVMNTLGAAYSLRGEFRKARKLHQEAMERMTKVLGSDHEDTLLAVDYLGKVISRFFHYEKARDLHLQAMAGMTKTLGPTHLNTLAATENVAMVYFEIGGKLLAPAQKLMEGVLNERKKKLGKEQPYTLLAIANLARIKNARGQTEEAENMLRTNLPIVERNLGENHAGALIGRLWLSQVLVKQKRYIEAEAILVRVMERHRYEDSVREDGENTDRIMVLWNLLEVYELQGKINDSLRIGDQLSEILKRIGEQWDDVETQHVFAKRLVVKLEDLRATNSHGGTHTV
ncbi:tetratricopeptide repeat domain-containing protein [Halenospora varia]|nr:tetratricopeptide repeat domain-containing protein [Halenospora varia]